MRAHDPIAELKAALAFPDTAIIVRGASVITEIAGPLSVRRSTDWLTLGEDSGSHLHVRAMLEVLDAAGALLCKVSFRRTNPARADRYDPSHAARVQAHFQHLCAEAS
jgi:hypothetical protein